MNDLKKLEQNYILALFVEVNLLKLLVILLKHSATFVKFERLVNAEIG